MVCREIEGGVNWPKVRQATREWLDDLGFRIGQITEDGAPDPETWGLSPAAIEAQERAMRMPR